MEKPTDAYPLTWPQGWKRTPPGLRRRARFSRGERQYSSDYSHSYVRRKEVSIADGTKRVLAELERMGFGLSVVISSNLALRQDGLPRSGQRMPDDPGVAVYWGVGANARCMAIDQYDRVADNLAAIAATLEALRAVERHGGAAIIERAFTGFVALPAPEQPWQVLGLASSRPTREEVTQAYRRLAMKHAPDRGGDADTMARINVARDQLLSEM